MVTAEDNYYVLVKIIELMTKSEKVQKSSFPDFVDFKECILDDFTDAFRLLPRIIEKELLPYSTIGKIILCYNFVDSQMVGDLTPYDSVESAERWQKLRMLASDVLKEIS